MRTLALLGSILAALLCTLGVLASAPQEPFVVAYPVPGSPQHVAVESPGRVWFTVPEHHIVGRLTVTTTADYHVDTYTSPIPNPLDVAFAAGRVWFAGPESEAIGCLDPVTGISTTFLLPTAESRPVALDVLEGTPVRVWFAEKGNNAIGQLVVTDTLDYAVYEYLLPEGKFGGSPEVSDVHVAGSDRVWFTAPGASAIGSFRPSYWPWSSDAFTPVSDPSGILPLMITADAQGYPWFTEVAGDRIGKFFPQTIALFDYYPVPATSPGLYQPVAARGRIWFTESDAGRIAYLDPATRTIHEYSVPGSRPLGLDVDAVGHVWIADGAGNRIIEWRAPYFHRVFLPAVYRY